jgi:hypothetical protein
VNLIESQKAILDSTCRNAVLDAFAERSAPSEGVASELRNTRSAAQMQAGKRRKGVVCANVYGLSRRCANEFGLKELKATRLFLSDLILRSGLLVQLDAQPGSP